MGFLRRPLPQGGRFSLGLPEVPEEQLEEEQTGDYEYQEREQRPGDVEEPLDHQGFVGVRIFRGAVTFSSWPELRSLAVPPLAEAWPDL